MICARMSVVGLQQQQKQQPLNILITGSSQGIGLAAAQQLIQQGHTVYHACRTEERAQEAVKAAGGGVALKACNLADLDSVQSFARDVQKSVPPLDVICLNAGIAPSAKAIKPPSLTVQGFEGGIGVNHLGHFLLAQLLVNKIVPGGRIVITASSVHDPDLKAGQSGGKGASLGDLSGLGVNLKANPSGPSMVDGSTEYHGGKVYKDSKLCNILMCRHAAKIFTVQTVCFNPGFVPTTGLFSSLRQESWWKAQALTLFASAVGFSVPVHVAGDRLVTMTTASSLRNGAYYCAPRKSKGTTPATGFVEMAPSKEARNDPLAAKLWAKSMEIVNDWL